jgi:putative membrane protein
MVIFSTLMMAGLVVLVVLLVRSLAPGTGADGLGADPTASARQILADRFARGELSATEYHERLDQLR